MKDTGCWDSMTRFAVIHGSHDVTLSRNVGFASIGHGYYLEDASEIENRLCHNLRIRPLVLALQMQVALDPSVGVADEQHRQALVRMHVGVAHRAAPQDQRMI